MLKLCQPIPEIAKCRISWSISVLQIASALSNLHFFIGNSRPGLFSRLCYIALVFRFIIVLFSSVTEAVGCQVRTDTFSRIFSWLLLLRLPPECDRTGAGSKTRSAQAMWSSDNFCKPLCHNLLLSEVWFLMCIKKIVCKSGSWEPRAEFC